MDTSMLVEVVLILPMLMPLQQSTIPRLILMGLFRKAIMYLEYFLRSASNVRLVLKWKLLAILSTVRYHVTRVYQRHLSIIRIYPSNQGNNMDIDKLKNIIKSNLVSFGLQPEQIEQITEQLLSDILDLMREE